MGRVVETLRHAERVDTSGWLVGGQVTVGGVDAIRPGWHVGFDGLPIPELNTDVLDGTYSSTLRLEDGRLVVQRGNHSTPVWPLITSAQTTSLAEGAYYTAEITTTNASSNYLVLGVDNGLQGSAQQRVALYIYNGSVRKNEIVDGVTQNTVVGSVEDNTTYVVEIHASEGGIEVRLYAKGADPETGISFRTDVDPADWSAVRFRINGSAGPDYSSAPIYVDNLRHALVRRTSHDYDAAGRLVSESDGHRTISNEYDGAGRLLRTVVQAAGVADRVTRNFYDDAGRLLGTLDPTGYLVEYEYDVAGNLIRTRRYASETPQAYRADGSLPQLRPQSSGNDQVDRYFYDSLGRQVGHLNAEGYLVVTTLDEVGNDRATREYVKRLTGLSGNESLATLLTLAAQGAPTPAYRETLRRFDALGRVSEELNHEGTLTRYHYDAEGRLERTERAAGTTEVREGRLWYDAFGQLIGELGGEASVGLPANATEAEK